MYQGFYIIFNLENHSRKNNRHLNVPARIVHNSLRAGSATPNKFANPSNSPNMIKIF